MFSLVDASHQITPDFITLDPYACINKYAKIGPILWLRMMFIWGVLMAKRHVFYIYIFTFYILVHSADAFVRSFKQ